MMPDSGTNSNSGRLRAALLLGGLATLLTGLGGLVLFLAGCRVLGVDVSTPYPALVAGASGLLQRGPLGYATWMALLMAGGSPLIGAAVFAMTYFGRLHAD
jgi:hypothetical protein